MNLKGPSTFSGSSYCEESFIVVFRLFFQWFILHPHISKLARLIANALTTILTPRRRRVRWCDTLSVDTASLTEQLFFFANKGRGEYVNSYSIEPEPGKLFIFNFVDQNFQINQRQTNQLINDMDKRDASRLRRNWNIGYCHPPNNNIQRYPSQDTNLM